MRPHVKLILCKEFELEDKLDDFFSKCDYDIEILKFIQLVTVMGDEDNDACILTTIIFN